MFSGSIEEVCLNTYSTCSRALLPPCLTCSSVSRVSCITCSRVSRVSNLACSCVSRTSCPTCSLPSRASCSTCYVRHMPCVLCALVLHVLCALRTIMPHILSCRLHAARASCLVSVMQISPFLLLFSHASRDFSLFISNSWIFFGKDAAVKIKIIYREHFEVTLSISQQNDVFEL